MTQAIVIFLVSLLVLMASSKYFTEAAERIGLSLNLSPFMIGVIIVALGTSLPELISGLFAAAHGHGELVIGNVIGANISNIFMILGVTSLFAVKGIQLGKEYIFIDLHFMLGSAALLMLFLIDGNVTATEGILLLVGFVIYQVYLIRSEKPKEMPTLNDEETVKQLNRLRKRDVLILLVAATGIFFSAKYTISAIKDIAHIFQIEGAFISLTIMSLGTTLPELAVSISAARAGHPEIAVGNILGSCIFNALLVMGLTSTISVLTIPEVLKQTSLIFFVVASVFFYLISQDKKISKWEGMLFLLFYVVFIVKVGTLL